MNNSGAIYVEHPDHRAVAAELERLMPERGFARADLRPGEISGRIMIPEKRRRHFFVMPAASGWVTVWEDPRYFGERALAQQIAAALSTRAVWIEVSGNGVAWAHGVYAGEETVEERYEEVETTFYGEYGVIHFAFDIDHTPDELIAALGLPYEDDHYESALLGELPADAGEPIHLAFEKC
ncbi:hypothetical protein K2Z83_17875 [Oscillochloris sp. ZM17-4]|uniref:hypothetical protein n=1 Tax=Oscillochloris sp. ZM17-4 TaxID=2866714 RepID=UPI001C72B8D7|nr:hypothetical protein [Oscillochloris sp. ZM17-4]MBX0329543.1 hypothetical protein [Oscillochloris sp. ZM17-4]